MFEKTETENNLESNYKYNFLFASLVLAIGVSLCGYFISKTTYNSAVAVNTAEAKGLSERKVKSDSALWNINFSVKGKSKDEINNLYKEAEKNQGIIVNLLKENNFNDSEISVEVLNYNYEEIRDSNGMLIEEIYRLRGVIIVKTEKVDKVEEVRSKVNKLVAQGIDIESEKPQYYFTKLNEIKPEMLREATTNARIAANEFAKDAGVKVGSIQSASQGGFSISDVAGGDSYQNTGTIEKDVRVVSTIKFYLTK